jgi:uncharacterized protein (TIGR00375 family)
MAPSFEIAEQINERLAKRGRLDYDGRPIFGFSSVEFVEGMMGISKGIVIIPAHAFTPWFSIFGSKSGFDSVEECFQDKAKHIFAIETGLSANPAMCWRISSLDKYTLISNSDSHSPYPWRLGREANAFELKDLTYENLVGAIRTRKGFLFTIEVPPEYGKYHLDGHRDCGVCLEPKESKKLGGKCPKCGRDLTIGVLSRAEELADRAEGHKPKGAVDFKSLIPLTEILGSLMGASPATKKVKEVHDKLLGAFGSEFNVLLKAQFNDLSKIVKEKVASAILRNREGRIKIQPGYDGVYGKPIFEVKESALGEFI